eukprot:4331908-Prymnesium_polylepis.1
MVYGTHSTTRFNFEPLTRALEPMPRSEAVGLTPPLPRGRTRFGRTHATRAPAEPKGHAAPRNVPGCSRLS